MNLVEKIITVLINKNCDFDSDIIVILKLNHNYHEQNASFSIK